MNVGWQKQAGAMWATSEATHSPGNALYRLVAASGGLLGLLLVAGASGHMTGVWPMLFGNGNGMDNGNLQYLRVFLLLLPGVILALTAAINALVCYPLWVGTQWALRLALSVNVLAAIYFTYLLQCGIPDHPIGFFLAFIAGQVIVLGAIQAGLRWPAVSLEGPTNDE